MTWIEFHASQESQIRREYRLWGNEQPKEPGQLGGKVWMDVKQGPDTRGFIGMQFPDAFVDQLIGSGTRFKRR